jgi:hypothetical protein
MIQHVFTTDESIILARLILLHLINDFLVQPGSWVKHRNKHHYKSWKLYVHGFLAGVAAYVAFWNWAALPAFVVVVLTHILIDIWKSYKSNEEKKLTYFILDQLAHLVILVLCWVAWISGFGKLTHVASALFSNYSLMVILLGYTICIYPIGYIINYITERWRKQIKDEGKDSLSEAGKWIGIIERALVFTLVFTGKIETIGLILAAKSILRFSNDDARKNTEYVLIGTLISFTLAIITGLFIKYLVI